MDSLISLLNKIAAKISDPTVLVLLIIVGLLMVINYRMFELVKTKDSYNRLILDRYMNVVAEWGKNSGTLSELTTLIKVLVHGRRSE